MADSEKAIFAGGCFWCTEAVFKPMKGVTGVVSGYIGGESENPTYHAVCSGTTGHAEAVEINFDPDLVSYDTLLDVFFRHPRPHPAQPPRPRRGDAVPLGRVHLVR